MLAYIYYLLVSFALWLRYSIKQSGIKKVKQSEEFQKNKGTLFLANHPAEIDPLILLKLFWFPFKLRPVAIEYIFQIPFVRYFLHFVGALSIPNFDQSTNSYKRRKIDQVYEKIFALLEQGENILIYPAGSLKQGGEEVIAGASGVHHILQRMPDVNVVFIRTTGLWGSSFSRAQTGRSPELISTFLHGLRVLLKNGLFFAPRRKVLVECTLAPKDFPRRGSKLEINRYLERWFNERGEEPMQLVSYSCWKEELPKIYTPKLQETISLEQIPVEIQEKIYEEIALLSGKAKEQLDVELDLSRDLGFDSLDIAQINLMLKEQFGVTNVNSADLTTIGSVMFYAARLKESGEQEEPVEEKEPWAEERERPPVHPLEGKTLIEAFMCNAKRMGEAIACADPQRGQVNYKQLRRAVVALSLKIREIPGENVGIMLPASVAVNVIILATLLAGKVPVMINWTLGERNLRSVVEQTGLQATLTSWQFLDRLENAELGGIEESFVLLEEMRRSIRFTDKIKSFYYLLLPWRQSIAQISRRKIAEEDVAVILFTSGTESIPKGVPLTHRNILSNLKSAYDSVAIQNQDILLGMLPPFHSFGFSITGLLPLLAGMRVVFFPNPTDGRRIVSIIEHWGVTLCCSAPTFLKGILRAARKGQLRSLRMVVVGAEKTSQELIEKMHSLNEATKMIEGYGITECSPILTLNPPMAPAKGVGKPLSNVQLLVVHPETHVPLSLGETGLILAHGPNIFRGYLDPSLRSPFISMLGKSWYETGDLGFIDSEGYLTLAGRLKRFVKIGGEMVSLGGIEEILCQAAVKQRWGISRDMPSLAVSATEEAGEKTKIHLFVTFEIDKAVVNEELRKSGMSNLIKISTVNQISALPLLGSGKINYRALLEILNGRRI